MCWCTLLIKGVQIISIISCSVCIFLAFFGLGAASPSASESESGLTVGKPLKICSVAFPPSVE